MLQDRFSVKYQDVKFQDVKFRSELASNFRVNEAFILLNLFHNQLFVVEIIVELFVVCQKLNDFCSCYIKQF